MDTEDIDFSVVIPAYNEEETIELALSRIFQTMNHINRRFEIIVVCDGDQNKTASALQHLRYSELRIIDLEVNRGKGFALRTGASIARGASLIFIDADLDLDAGRLPELIHLYENQHLDLLVGSKLHPNSIVHYPKSRRFMSSLYRRIIKSLFGLNVSDTQTGLKICKRESFLEIKDDLFVDGFAFDLELICRFEKKAFTIGEGPVTLNFQFKSTVNYRSILIMIISTYRIYKKIKEND
jgi:glycosyltransferase involved in cell wall biosynthesis